MQIGNTRFQKHATLNGWWYADGFSSDDVIEERARAINALGLAPKFTAVCGLKEGDDAHHLYLVPSISPVEVARLFAVGSCGGFGALDDSTEALEVVKRVNKKAPIAPYFADTNGFKFVFRNGLPSSLLPFLERTISVGTEAMMDAEGQIGSSILGRGFVHLWWD